MPFVCTAILLYCYTIGSTLVHLSRGLAPELEQLRTQDINPDEDSAAYRALKRITIPVKKKEQEEQEEEEEDTPESTDDALAAAASSAADNRKAKKKKQKKKQRNIEGREIKQVSHIDHRSSIILTLSWIMHHTSCIRDTSNTN